MSELSFSGFYVYKTSIRNIKQQIQ